MISRLQRQFRDTKLLVHFLVCVFAIASWANLNGMWSELPQLVTKAPEKWDLPSYITIISQVANIGPLLFVLITFLLPRTKGKIEVYGSAGVILLSIVSSFFLAFYWDKTSYLAGQERSTSLLALNFFMAFGDCVSSVAFYAFMAMLKPEYMASLLIGEGLSGMLPAMIALGQGVGDISCDNISSTTNTTFPNGTEYNKTTWNVYPVFGTPEFSVEVYFILLASILTCSFIAFILLNVLPYCRTEFVDPLSDTDNEKIISTEQEQDNYSAPSFDNLAFNDNANMDISQNLCYSSSLNVNKHRSFVIMNVWGMAIDCEFLSLQAIVVIINMTLTSFLSTIQIFSTLPYGLRPYHLAITLSQIANPVACIFVQFIMARGLPVISLIALLGESGVAYIIYLASMSPDPPLHDQTSGGNLAVTVWVFTTLFLIYAKVCVAGVMRTRGRSYLISTGVSTQVGSFIGAIVGFLLVNKTHTFQQAPYC